MKKTLTCSLLLALALPVVAFADGAAIFKTKCAPCHGADGSGQTPVGKNLKVKDLRSAEVQKLKGAAGRREDAFQKSFAAEKNQGNVLNRKFDELLKQAKENPEFGKKHRDFDLD